MTSLAKFKADLDKAYRRKVLETSTKVVKEVVGTLFRFISVNSASVSGYGSPVFTGRYHASHKVMLNSIDTSTMPPAPDGTLGAYKELDLSVVTKAMANFKLGDTTFISNSVPYASGLEFEEFSGKTPDGIYLVSVDAAIASLPDIIQKEIRSA